MKKINAFTASEPLTDAGKIIIELKSVLNEKDTMKSQKALKKKVRDTIKNVTARTALFAKEPQLKKEYNVESYKQKYTEEQNYTDEKKTKLATIRATSDLLAAIYDGGAFKSDAIREWWESTSGTNQGL
jgi:hypothetical protein